MRKILKSILPFLLVCALLAGCGGAAAPAASSPAEAPSDSTAAPAEASAPADDYPNKPITLILTVAAGGAVESGARIWQPYVEAELGVPLNFEFHNGANSQIGFTVMSQGTTDGYTLGVYDPIALSNTLLLQDPDYDFDSFDYICSYMRDPGVLLANKDEPYNTLEELIEYAKTQPEGSLTIGVPAITDVNVIGIRQLEEATGVKFNVVPFNGGGKARTALAGHQIPLGAFMYFGSSAVWEDTKVLAMNVASTNVEALQGVQTFNEVAGKTLDDVFSLSGVCAPAGFKEAYPERYQLLCEAFERAFANPELLAKLAELDQVEWLNPVIGEDELVPLNEAIFEFCKENAHYLE